MPLDSIIDKQNKNDFMKHKRVDIVFKAKVVHQKPGKATSIRKCETVTSHAYTSCSRFNCNNVQFIV